MSAARARRTRWVAQPLDRSSWEPTFDTEAEAVAWASQPITNGHYRVRCVSFAKCPCCLTFHIAPKPVVAQPSEAE